MVKMKVNYLKCFKLVVLSNPFGVGKSFEVLLVCSFLYTVNFKYSLFLEVKRIVVA